MITLWHNPRCSKSRQALALLEEAGAEVTVRRYLVDQPTQTELKHVLKLLGLPPSAVLRTGEKIFKELNLADEEDEEALLGAMIDNPILIERPIAIHLDRAVIGRPPEEVLTLLD